MNKLDIIIQKGHAYVWLALFVACTVGIILCGAYWHFWTALVCWVMWRSSINEAREAESKN